MESAYTLRAATPADAAAIVDLIRELAVFEKLEHLVRITPEMLSKQLFGPRPAAEAIVAEAPAAAAHGDAGAATPTRVVAFALYFTNFSTFLGQPGLYLEDLYVQPEYRQQGLGKALLKRLAQTAVQRGCGRFEWSVLDWNVDAIGFYRRMGATLMDDWRICRVSGAALAELGQAEAAG